MVGSMAVSGSIVASHEDIINLVQQMTRYENEFNLELMQTVEETVYRIMGEMSPQDMLKTAFETDGQPSLLSKLLVEYLATELKEPSNKDLLQDCRAQAGYPSIDETRAAEYIFGRVKKRLREIYS